MSGLKMLFELTTTGHSVEYIHHLYMMMVSKTEADYVIVLPDDFKTKMGQYDWPETKNVFFDFIPNSVAASARKGNLLFASLKQTNLLKTYINKHKATHIFLISLINYIPFLPLLVSKRVVVSGIIYKIYLYEWAEYSVLRKIVEVIKYKIISFDNCLKSIFILNDSSSASMLNKLYKTNKFHFLVDPYNSIDYTPRNIREELAIPLKNTVFLHFGSLNKRKGTINILKALEMIPDNIGCNITIVMAGQVRSDIKEDFYNLINNDKHHCQLLLFDNYCTSEFILDLCNTCDFVLIPYDITAQSSGLIAYAARFGKPIIGPGTGLIGKLIRKYKLGEQLLNTSPESISKAMMESSVYIINSNYIESASVSMFQKQISCFF